MWGCNSSFSPLIFRSGTRTPLTAVLELPTVDENAIAEEDEAEPEEDVEARLAEQLDVQDNQASRRRMSGASGFSGTTAKTSFSQEEINKLDPDVICDVLPDALANAERLTQLLVPNGLTTPPETWKEIKRTGSKHNKLYSTRWESLRILRPILTSVEYIEPSHVLRSLLKVQSVAEVQPATWRPDNILYKINMALMLRAVLITCDPSDWTEEATGALESLDMAFPACIAGGQLDFYALDLWLEIAAHVTIRRIEAAISSGSTFSPLEEIDNVFYDGNEEFKHLKAFGFMTAHEDDREQGLATVDARIALLKSRFGEDGTDATAINGNLKAQFRWEDLRSNTLRYYVARLVEVDRHIEAAGGVEAIVIGLEQEAERVKSEKTAEEMKQQYTTTGKASRQSLGKSAMALLKGREKQITQQQPAPTAVMSTSTALPQNEDVIIHDFAAQDEFDDVRELDQTEEEPPVVEPSTAQQAVAKLNASQNQNAKKAKARLMDRQANAVRIGSDMFEETQPEATTTAAKRTHAEMEEQGTDEFNPTQDDGFENDVRDHSNAAQRRAEVAALQPRPQRAPQRFETIEPRSTPVAGPSTAARPSPAKRPRKNPGSAIPPPRARPDPDAEVPVNQIYKEAKEDARYNRVTSSQARPPQIRQPWSDEEESALIDLIVDHVDPEDSISYSKLKAVDNELQTTDEAKLTMRTAEDIRFKARNMKLTLLLADRKLPRNWEKVILDKKAITKLHSRGIDYTQERVRAERRNFVASSPARSETVRYTTGGVV